MQPDASLLHDFGHIRQFTLLRDVSYMNDEAHQMEILIFMTSKLRVTLLFARIITFYFVKRKKIFAKLRKKI